MSIDDKALRAALRPLGRTPEGVRRKLQAAGVAGTPEHPSCCAVAEYLKATFPGEDNVEVLAHRVVVNGAEAKPHRGVQEFIIGFDDWDYPELIAHREHCAGASLTESDGFGEGHELQVDCTCHQVYRLFDIDDRAVARRYLKRALQGTFPAAT